MERIYAHTIVFNGCRYHNHVIELADDGSITLFPFVGEIHSTRFISGTVRVSVADNPLRLVAHYADSDSGQPLEALT